MSIPVKRRPLGNEEKVLLQSPTISSQLPLSFNNNSTLNEWSGYCIECNKEIKQSLFRGRITRPNNSVALMTAVGICEDCNLVTNFNCRIKDDLSMEWLDNDGQWYRSDKKGKRLLLDEPPTPAKSKAQSLILWWGIFLMFMMPMICAVMSFKPHR